MKIYGDTISPFVRMCLVAAHECGLAGKLEHVKEAVKPTQANPKLTALSALGSSYFETDHHPIFDRVSSLNRAHVAGTKPDPDDGVKRFVPTLKAGPRMAMRRGHRMKPHAPQGRQWRRWWPTDTHNAARMTWTRTGDRLAEVSAGNHR